jgi:glycosyltransferase involved in cell wall biosynthesis
VHLAALVENPEHVCCRYRLAAFRPFLEQAGHSLELRSWPRSWWSRIRLGRELRHADAVLIQRRLVPIWQLGLLRRSVRRLLFDLDDAVFLRDSYSPRGLHSARRQRRFQAMVQAADVVIAGNPFLAEQAARAAGKGHVHLIPTCVDPGRYPLANHHHGGDGMRLAWIGSSSTLRGLEAVRALLEEIGRRVPKVRLRLICDRAVQFAHLAVEHRPWSEDTEACALAGADVGISWVPDDLWSQGKCALKVLQYMAAGLPVVANPVGVQADLVRHGQSGFLAQSPDEWCAALATLARDPGLRRRMGQAGRRRVEREFSVAEGAKRWAALLAIREPQRRAA